MPELTAALAAELATRSDEELAALVAARPDAVRGRPPATSLELAQRLLLTSSVAAALPRLTLPQMQVLVVVAALGGGVPPEELARRLDRSGDDHPVTVASLARSLASRALLVEVDRSWHAPPAVLELMPDPLGLGRPAEEVLASENVDGLRRRARRLGLVVERPNRPSLLAAIVARYRDAEWVRAAVEQAPPAVADWLSTSFDDGSAADPPRPAAIWLDERGLGLRVPWGWTDAVEVPAEVRLSWWGPDWSAELTPLPPPLVSTAVDPRQLEAESSVALTSTVDLVVGMVDLVAQKPVATVRAGGVGTRELSRLAKLFAVDDLAVRLAVEIGIASGVLAATPLGLTLGPAAEEVRDAAPGERAARLLTAWWQLGHKPSEDRDADGRVLPAGRPGGGCSACEIARHAWVAALAAAPGTAVPDDLVAVRAEWSSPLAHIDGTIADEARRLGVTALGALSPLGQALLAGDGAALVAAAGQLLPPPSRRAVFGSDLTAYVAGPPTSALAALLDSAATREGRGGAVVWRFSPASVRSALDGGATAHALLDALAAASERALPQSLQVLVADVARRYGEIAVSPAHSVLRVDDPAVLAELLHDKRLRAMALRQVDDGVLAAAVDEAEALRLLRATGRFPTGGAPSGPDLGAAARTLGARAATMARAGPEPPDVGAMVARWRSGTGREDEDGTDPGDDVSSVTAVRLGRSVRQLSDAEVALLAYAIDEGVPISITYRAASGAVTGRTLDGVELFGGMVRGWCRLRQDERTFALSGIVAVGPA